MIIQTWDYKNTLVKVDFKTEKILAKYVYNEKNIDLEEWLESREFLRISFKLQKFIYIDRIEDFI